MLRMGTTRFPLRFDRWFGVLSSALLLRPGDSFVEVSEHEVHCRLGWAFRATFPRSAVRGTAVSQRRPLSRGAHGFGGRWLVNGAGDRLLEIDLREDQRAFVLGVPVRLRQLLVSVDDPAALGARLTG